MRRAAAIAIMLLAVRVTAEPATRLTATSTNLDAGPITARADDSAEAVVELSIESSAAWQLFVALRPAGDGTPLPRNDRVAVRRATGEWADGMAGVPALVATGTGAATSLRIPIRVHSSFAASAGRRHARLQWFTTDGAALDTFLEYDVRPTMVLTTEEDAVRPLAPAAGAEFVPFADEAYRVQSNVEWSLDVTLQSRLRTRESMQPLHENALFVTTAADPLRRPLHAGTAVTVGSGAATGDSGTLVRCSIVYRSSGNDVAGTYQSQVQAVLRERAPAAAGSPDRTGRRRSGS